MGVEIVKASIVHGKRRRDKWAPKMLQLHPGILEDPEIDGLSQGAFRLLVSSLCYSVQHDTNWFVTTSAMRRIMPRYRARYAAELVDAGLFHARGADGYEIREPSTGVYTYGRPAWKSKRLDSRVAIPIELRLAVYERDGFQCLECGAKDDLTLDHIHPFSLGGEDTYENLRTLCRSCNSKKGARV